MIVGDTLWKLFGVSGYYFTLSPSTDRINWVQKSLGDLSPDWGALPNNVPHFRNQLIIEELFQEQSINRFALMYHGRMLDEDILWYQGLLVDLRYDYAEAVFASNRNHRIRDVFFYLKVIQNLAGYMIFDHQLQQNIDLIEDGETVEAKYAEHIAQQSDEF